MGTVAVSCVMHIAVYSRRIPFYEIFFPISTCFCYWLVDYSAVFHIGISKSESGKNAIRPSIGKCQRGTKTQAGEHVIILRLACFLRLFITWWLTQSSPFSAMALLASFSRHLVLLQRGMFSCLWLLEQKKPNTTVEWCRMVVVEGSNSGFSLNKTHQLQLHVFS